MGSALFISSLSLFKSKKLKLILCFFFILSSVLDLVQDLDLDILTYTCIFLDCVRKPE